ncbi:MAG: L-2-hydroxyglutarate oxidase [Nitrospirae bacterium]|nr:MAG: L-2-hydroxyglutarate oxidase [Nitrospirota bacterium]
MQYDFLIIGGGIVGLAIARELRARQPRASIAVLEKETELALHGSGRNSGVLHSGIYYPPSSLKARLCKAGSDLMSCYCRESGLPCKKLGKVIVPLREEADCQIDELYRRAVANGARVEILDEVQLHELEPSTRTASGRALYSPDTSVVDPRAVVQHLAFELKAHGIKVLTGREVRKIDIAAHVLKAGGETFSYGWLFNCAGLFADKIAHKFKVGMRYSILPFKGIYYRLSPESRVRCRGLIYPVPDLKVPFLGVHYTKKVDGSVYLGPTAVPAFGREHYQGFDGIVLSEAAEVLYYILNQYLSNRQGFRDFANQEAFRFLRRRFAEAARALTPELKQSDLIERGKVGIRAQLFDKEAKELVMDFVVERGDRSTHVLNAVSPAFTSSMSFAKYILDKERM